MNEVDQYVQDTVKRLRSEWIQRYEKGLVYWKKVIEEEKG